MFSVSEILQMLILISIVYVNFLQMVRTYNRNTTRGAASGVLERAADDVIQQGQSFRSTALAYGVDK